MKRETRMRRKIFARAVLGALFTYTLSLSIAPQAFADLKSVATAVCDAHDDHIVSTAGPSPSTAPDGKPIPVCSSAPSNCRELMVCMDRAGWHVIHDTRYPGAWAEGPALGFPMTEAFYKLLFQKD